LAGIAGFSFYSGFTRQGGAGPHSGRSGTVVVIPPQPQVVAWQQGPSLGEPAAPAEPQPKHRRASFDASAPDAATPPAAASEAARDASAQEAAPAAAPTPPADPGTPPPPEDPPA
jgi:hypothetical protein